MSCCAEEVICLWLGGRNALYSVTHTVYSSALPSFFPALGFSCAMTKLGLALLSLRSDSIIAWGDANRVLPSKPQVYHSCFFFPPPPSPFTKSPHSAPLSDGTLLGQSSTCHTHTISRTDCQDECFGAEFSKVPLKFAHVSVSRNILWMLRPCSYEQWYQLAWAASCSCQHRMGACRFYFKWRPH